MYQYFLTEKKHLIKSYELFMQKILRTNQMAAEGVFECVDLRPSQHIGVMSSMINLPNHTFTRQA